MCTLVKLTIIFLFTSTILRGQDKEIQTRLSDGELKMTFPSIYFKHNSTDYATMPYTVDSCFKFIATNIEYLNSYPIWRDSSETEHLTNVRIKKLMDDLNKYTPTRKINIKSVHNKQKVSQRTINKTSDKEQIKYLLSLNSVLDVSGAIHPNTKKNFKNHKTQYFIWCPFCWVKSHASGVPWRVFPKKVKTKANSADT